MDDLFQKIKQKFPFLDEEKMAEMLSLGEMVNLKAGEVFIERGSRSHLGCIVLEGLMRNYIVNDKGEEITVVFASEMQVIATYATIFLDKPASETTEAIEPSLLFVMDYKKLQERLTVDPTYTLMYASVLEQLLISAIQRIEDFTQKRPLERYERLLQTHGHLIERVPLKHLASYLGINPASLSRIRKRLSKKRN